MRTRRDSGHTPRPAGIQPYRSSPRPPDAIDLDALPLPSVITVAGTGLPVRLVRGMPRLRELGGLGVLTVLWNAGVVLGVLSELRANDVILGLVLIPCGLIGAALLSSLVRHLRLFALREPVLELDAHPLRQGSVHALSITLRGPLAGGSVTVELRGIESTISNTRNAPSFVRTFFAARLLEGEGVELARDERWTRRLEVAVPQNVPSSFAVPGSSLRYEVVVTTATLGLPEPEENAYPVLVLPLASGAGG